jgi:hypothetical protein
MQVVKKIYINNWFITQSLIFDSLVSHYDCQFKNIVILYYYHCCMLASIWHNNAIPYLISHFHNIRICTHCCVLELGATTFLQLGHTIQKLLTNTIHSLASNHNMCTKFLEHAQDNGKHPNYECPQQMQYIFRCTILIHNQTWKIICDNIKYLQTILLINSEKKKTNTPFFFFTNLMILFSQSNSHSTCAS